MPIGRHATPTSVPRALLGVLLLALLAACPVYLFLGFVSYPATDTIAIWYLQAVANSDQDSALRLGGGDAVCRGLLQESVERDIAEFGGAKLRDIVVEVAPAGGSDESLQYAQVTFEYQRPGETTWRNGSLSIDTDHAAPGLRYTCGSSR